MPNTPSDINPYRAPKSDVKSPKSQNWYRDDLSAYHIISKSFEIFIKFGVFMAVCAAPIIFVLPLLGFNTLDHSSQPQNYMPSEPSSYLEVSLKIVLVVAILGLLALLKVIFLKMMQNYYSNSTLFWEMGPRFVARSFAAFLISSLIFYISVGVGLLLLIAPGLVLFFRFALVTESAVLETGNNAFARSRQICHGRNRILFYTIIFEVFVNTALFTPILNLWQPGSIYAGSWLPPFLTLGLIGTLFSWHSCLHFSLYRFLTSNVLEQE